MTDKSTLLENVLVSKLKSGDNSAFSTIFSAYYRDLVLFAARFTRNQENAEEIVQDIFVNLWENHESLKIDISLKSFLLKSIQNKCIDMIRHRKIKDIHVSYVLENQT
ncbi:MAG: sigma-70 family RNA polymerase sigma factor, partial [Clostridiaceae bacterium]|nr:sigma-70 family RNA polymerase sigma factor [Clostridiaceae bacterium]